jgi:hypothetical protein
MQLIIEGSRDRANPSRAEVEEAIRAMDGISRTQVALFESESVALTVGGGGGNFVVAIQKGTVVRVVLARPRPQGEDGWLEICNGQPVDYPLCEVVSVHEAVIAASAFLEDRREAPELLWDDLA